MDEQKDHEVVRDVFGDSDEEEPAEYSAQNEIEQNLHVRPRYRILVVFVSRRELCFLICS